MNSGVEYSDTLLTFKLLGKLAAFMSFLIQKLHFIFNIILKKVNATRNLSNFVFSMYNFLMKLTGKPKSSNTTVPTSDPDPAFQVNPDPFPDAGF